MITRPENLKIVQVNIEFNFRIFNHLEIDLDHINKTNRSNLTEELVTDMVKKFISKAQLAPVGHMDFGVEDCSYFVKTGVEGKKKYKLVFCVCSDRPNSLGIITLHRLRGTNESL